MKIESSIWTGAKILLAVAGLAMIVLGLNYIADQGDTKAQSVIDTWVNQRLVDALGRKLDQPSQMVRDALQNPANSPLSDQIAQLVRSVSLTFERQSSSRVQIKLDLLYTDDTIFSTAIETDWDELPAMVRKEFLQTGNQTVRRIWSLFPNRLST
ncbi:hypothetical protein B9G53_01160 [Pseudanabaena sp. SR411]|uniref:hypothetical protein n=1 Tax=Pseudanabaena sp. SR411 TaxID=1980935 RepID=UPI000B994607|nr:hypothetical protein [Pseudanabaena sp. SR411]OYQ67491.1 hypothetical protein B9G53_01160 [Pseudanabaena sp. SR411]